MSDLDPGSPSRVRVALVVVGNDLRRKIRDRTALLMGIVTPLVMAGVIGLAFGGGFSFSATIAVVDEDGSALSRGITDGLLEGFPPDVPIRLVRAEDRDAARTDLTSGSIDAVVVVPAGFGAAVTAGGSTSAPSLVVLVDANKRIGGDVARSIADRVGAQIETSTLAVATALDAETAAGATPDVAAVVADARALDVPIALDQADVGASYAPVAYFGASMGILFLFFTVGGSARSLIAERREGTLQRVRAAPVDDTAVLLGKAAAVLVIGFASLVTIWVVTTFVFRVSWGDPLAVLAVIVAVVIAIAGISTLIAGLARTDAQADGFTAVVAFVFALLGGSFFQPGGLPPVLDVLTLVTPNGWALRAVTSIGAGQATVVDILPNLVVLLLIGVVTAVVGTRALRAKVLR